MILNWRSYHRFLDFEIMGFFKIDTDFFLKDPIYDSQLLFISLISGKIEKNTHKLDKKFSY